MKSYSVKVPTEERFAKIDREERANAKAFLKGERTKALGKREHHKAVYEKAQTGAIIRKEIAKRMGVGHAK